MPEKLQGSLMSLFEHGNNKRLVERLAELVAINLDKGVAMEDMKEWYDRGDDWISEFPKLLQESGISL